MCKGDTATPPPSQTANVRRMFAKGAHSDGSITRCQSRIGEQVKLRWWPPPQQRASCPTSAYPHSHVRQFQPAQTCGNWAQKRCVHQNSNTNPSYQTKPPDVKEGNGYSNPQAALSCRRWCPAGPAVPFWYAQG